MHTAVQDTVLLGPLRDGLGCSMMS